MKKRRIYHTNTAFLDLLFCTLLLFTGLFTIAFILISPTKEDKKVDAKAEFIITVTWPKDFDDDVDTYCEDPSGHLVFFRRREDGLMHLDRDDLGKRNDTIRMVRAWCRLVHSFWLYVLHSLFDDSLNRNVTISHLL